MSVRPSTPPRSRAPAVPVAQVAQLGLHPVDRVGHPGTVPALPPRRRFAGEVPRRADPASPSAPRLRHPVLGELPDRLEQAVPGAGGGVVGDHERLPDERVEIPEYLDVLGAFEDLGDARQLEAAREH